MAAIWYDRLPKRHGETVWFHNSPQPKPQKKQEKSQSQNPKRMSV